MSADSESFLTRWSRRKLAAERAAERPAEDLEPGAAAALPTKDGNELAAPAAAASVRAPAPEQDPAVTTEVPLPPIDSLDGLRSDYEAFFKQPVAEELRRAALKKLFADPHFNQMDMMDVYVDDYTQFEPLTAALRMRLPSARAFLSDAERAEVDAAEASAASAGDAPAPLAAAAGGDVEAAAGPDDGGEGFDSAAADVHPESNSEREPESGRTRLPASVSSGVPSADDPAAPLREASLTAVPPGKAIAPDSTST